MSSKRISSQDREKKFKQMLVAEYLKYGSVDEVFRKSESKLPVSYAHYQRILDEWEIVKAAGPNSKLSEILSFLTRLTEEKIPLEILYKKMPPGFRTSAVTLYRILSYIKEGITRRVATGLVITHPKRERKILVGNDISIPRPELGKPYGAISMPVGFSRKTEPGEISIRRVLQQEVFTKMAVKKRMPNIVPELPKPFMFLDIADIRVEVFHLTLPKNLTSIKNFSSFKLQNFKFISIDSIISGKVENLRAGAVEVATGFSNYLELRKKNLSLNPTEYKSKLNYFLANSF